MKIILFSCIKDVYFSVKEKGIEGQIPYLEIGNINIEDKSYSFTNKKSVNGCNLARKHDILISRVRPTRGAVTQVMEKYLQVSSAFCVLRNISMADKYLYYYLIHNSQFYNYLGNNCTGTMYPTVTEEFILNYKIPIVSINEQNRIVAKLDYIIPKINNVKERLERIPQIIKRFRQSVLSAAVTGKLTEKWREENPDVESADILIERIKREKGFWLDFISESNNSVSNWKEIYLGNVIKDFKYGTSMKSSKDFNGLPVLRIPNVLSKYVDLSDIKYLETSDVNENNKVSKGDILLVRSNGSRDLVGKCCLVDNIQFTYAFASYLIRIRPLLVSSDYIYLLLNTPNIKEQFFLNAKSSAGVNNINTKALSKTIIPLPPLKEQHEIVRQVDKLFSLADKLEVHYKKAKEKIDKLPQSVLAKAFRGELVRQDPDDEPAEKLLERIKEEKARLEAEMKNHRTRKPKKSK